MWYQKYKTQHDENAKLEDNIKLLEEKLLELQGHFREGYCGLFVEIISDQVDLVLLVCVPVSA